MSQPANYTLKVKDREFKLELDTKNPNSGLINGKAFMLDLVGNTELGLNAIHNNKSYAIQILESDYSSKDFKIKVNGSVYDIKANDRFDLLLKELGMEQMNANVLNDLAAPMPGKVLGVEVEAGQEIKKGDALLVLEAMKMENVLKAEADGIIKSIKCQVGIAVEKGEVLIEFEG